MESKNNEDLKLIYILKIGYNSKNEGMYEFLFSEDETNIDVELWNWDISPACDNATPPTDEYVDAIISLKTSKFNLYCLHESPERCYMHGFHTIHALAYEVPNLDNNDGYAQFENLIPENDLPLLVFHYGTTLASVMEKLYARNIVLKNNEFVDFDKLKF